MKVLGWLLAFVTTVSLSAYTPYECGGNRVTASGEECIEGITCASNIFPLYTRIIWNNNTYVVTDRMAPQFQRHVDLFMEDYNKAIQFGRREAEIVVILPK